MSVEQEATHERKDHARAVVAQEDFATPFQAEGYPKFGNRLPALRSFYLAYDIGDATPGDHEILHMQVMVGGASHDLSPNVNFQPANIQDGRLNVALQDADGSEKFFYRVSHSTLAIPGTPLPDPTGGKRRRSGPQAAS
jgi:hypothetical protein